MWKMEGNGQSVAQALGVRRVCLREAWADIALARPHAAQRATEQHRLMRHIWGALDQHTGDWAKSQAQY